MVESDVDLDKILKDMHDNFYTVTQASRVLGLAVGTIRKYCFAARQPDHRCSKNVVQFPAKKFGEYLVIPRQVVDDYRKNRQPQGRPRKSESPR